jgi:hypothetical protein
LEETLHFLAIVFAGLSAGTFVMALAVAAAERAVPSGVALEFHKALEPRVDRFNPPLVIGAMVMAGLLLVLKREDLLAASALWTGAGLLGTVVVAVMSVGFNMRINRRMRPMSLDPVPDEYLPLRRRWERFHLVRTLGGVLALIGFTLAGLTA